MMKRLTLALAVMLAVTPLAVPSAARADIHSSLLRASPQSQARLFGIAEPDCDKLRAQALACLACNIYHEARSEGRDGMRLVGKVTMNRVGSPLFPGRVCDVVWQGSAQGRPQFSWTADGRPDRVHEPEAWREAVEAAAVMIFDHYDPDVSVRIGGRIYGSELLWYHTRSVRPGWGSRLQKVAEVGSHVVYRSPVSN